MIKYESKIREIIANTIKLTVPIEEISINTDFRNVGMDSLAYINLVSLIEDNFQIEFPMEKLIMAESSTIQKLSDIIIMCTDTHYID